MFVGEKEFGKLCHQTKTVHYVIYKQLQVTSHQSIDTDHFTKHHHHQTFPPLIQDVMECVI